MPTVTTNYFREHEGGENVNLSADTWVASLMDSYVSATTSDTLKAIETWSEVSANEVSGTNYTSGSTLTNVILSSTGNTVYMDADDITFSNVSVSAYGTTIWRSTDGLVIGFVDFSEVIITSNGDLDIIWNSGGILNKI